MNTVSVILFYLRMNTSNDFECEMRNILKTKKKKLKNTKVRIENDSWNINGITINNKLFGMLMKSIITDKTVIRWFNFNLIWWMNRISQRYGKQIYRIPKKKMSINCSRNFISSSEWIYCYMMHWLNYLHIVFKGINLINRVKMLHVLW